MNYGCQHTKILIISIFNYIIEKNFEQQIGVFGNLFFYKFEHNSNLKADIKVIYIVINVLLDNIL